MNVTFDPHSPADRRSVGKLLDLLRDDILPPSSEAPAVLTGAPLAAVDALLAATVDKLPEPPTTMPNLFATTAAPVETKPADNPVAAMIGIGTPTPPAADPPLLAAINIPVAKPGPDFEVFDANGEMKAGYSHAEDAVTVLTGLIGDITAAADLERIAAANKALYERLETGQKSRVTRTVNKRREELATIDAALMGSAPATAERAALNAEQFIERFRTLVAKTGVQVLNEVWQHILPAGAAQNVHSVPAEKYWAALDILQGVLDSKGK